MDKEVEIKVTKDEAIATLSLLVNSVVELNPLELVKFMTVEQISELQNKISECQNEIAKSHDTEDKALDYQDEILKSIFGKLCNILDI